MTLYCMEKTTYCTAQRQIGNCTILCCYVHTIYCKKRARYCTVLWRQLIILYSDGLETVLHCTIYINVLLIHGLVTLMYCSVKTTYCTVQWQIGNCTALYICIYNVLLINRLGTVLYCKDNLLYCTGTGWELYCTVGKYAFYTWEDGLHFRGKGTD